MFEKVRAINWLAVGLISVTVVACGGGGSGDSLPAATLAADTGGSNGDSSDGKEDVDACGVPAQIDFVEAITERWYLWYGEMAEVDKAAYQSAEAYLDARLAPLITEGRDRGFSYMTTVTEDETSISSGAYVGLGGSAVFGGGGRSRSPPMKTSENCSR